MEETITIRFSDLKKLVEDRLELRELEYAGVDNWQGYDETGAVTDDDVIAAMQIILETAK